MVDEDCHRSGGVRPRLEQVVGDPLAVEVLAGQETHLVTPDLADEAGRQPAPRGPDRNVCATPPGQEHHLTEGVPTAEQFAVRPDQYIPGEVPEDAQGRLITHDG